jgi:ABC-type siderophore export system fused ATPase/permease subunit
MADQELRDDRNRLVGRIRTLWDGRHELRDDRNRLKGYYNPKTNETRDDRNRLIARGNMLATLL